MSTLLSVLIAIVIFCVIIIVHEFGHFFVARMCGIRVDEFAIGMGPVIFKKQGKMTLFTVRAVPMGGFCQMGEDEDNDDPNSFRKKPVLHKIAVIAAGAIMNLILGLVLSVIVTLVNGEAISSKVIYLADNAVSGQYGLQINDTIEKINGVKIFTVQDITYQLSNDADGIVDMIVIRNGEKVHLGEVHFEIGTNPETGKQTLTYDFKVAREKITITNFLPYSFKNAIYYGRIVIMTLIDIIKGNYGINDIQGLVGIVTAITEITKTNGFDIGFLLDIATLITINIGIFNLLPIPALDGGRIVFLIIEGIRRKQIKAEIEGLIHLIGFALLILLMIVVTFNDIKNIFIKYLGGN